MGLDHTCYICHKPCELNLFIMGYCVCGDCESRVLKERVGSRPYEQIRRAIADIILLECGLFEKHHRHDQRVYDGHHGHHDHDDRHDQRCKERDCPLKSKHCEFPRCSSEHCKPDRW